MDHDTALVGTASSVLAAGVRHLDPAPAVFEAMLDGWSRQQRSCFLQADATIKPRLEVVRRFARFSNQYPWQWTPGELEAFMVSISVAMSTARSCQNALRLFCDHVTDARYGWPGECLQRFGAAPQQVLHEWNSVVHNVEFEGRTSRRPLSYDEVQSLFDAADGRVEEIRETSTQGSRRRATGRSAAQDGLRVRAVSPGSPGP